MPVELPPPLIGAPAPVVAAAFGLFRSHSALVPMVPRVSIRGTVRPTGLAFRPGPEGWTSTSTPSLEERLDDHQPTRAWENGEGHG
jgi:hypothetical protein